MDKAKIEDYFISVPELSGFHDLHIWTMDGEYNILTVHLA